MILNLSLVTTCVCVESIKVSIYLPADVSLNCISCPSLTDTSDFENISVVVGCGVGITSTFLQPLNNIVNVVKRYITINDIKSFFFIS